MIEHLDHKPAPLRVSWCVAKRNAQQADWAGATLHKRNALLVSQPNALRESGAKVARREDANQGIRMIKKLTPLTAIASVGLGFALVGTMVSS